jgi:hypothetical protein
MKYVFLAYRDEKQWAALSATERDTLEAACQATEQALRQSGHLFVVEEIQNSDAAMTVRVVHGLVALSAGPLAETQGELSQLFFINARDLNEAIRLASTMPHARRGPIEVRPVVALDRPSKSN